MDLKYLHTFQTIVISGSFSEAAKQLNYTQSTITFQITQLEQELGVQLFEKIGRRMVLTQAGKLLVPYVEDVLSSVNKMHYLEKDLASCVGDLSIGIAESLLCYKLPPILERFHQKAPNARLFIRSMNCYDIRDELLNGSLDLGVFYKNVNGFGDKLTTYPLHSYPNVAIASPGTAQNLKSLSKANCQLSVPFIINEKNCIFRQIFEAFLQKRSISVDHTIELWSIPTIINLVKSDVGISYLPRFTVEEDLATGILQELNCPANGTIIDAICAHHKNKWVSPLMQLFLDLCLEAFSMEEA